MKITLHMAVSMDGFIAKPDGDSNWVSKIDGDLFVKRCKDAGCIVVGKTTFDQFYDDLYPMDGITNIVLTSSTKPERQSPDVSFVNSAQQAIELAEKKGYDKLLVAGGGRTNASFLESNMIDEIFLSVHPLTLSEGIKLFEGSKLSHEFKLVDTRKLGDDLVEIHYIRK